MPQISQFLVDRLSVWAGLSGISFSEDDPIFVREVLNPLVELVGEDLPTSDARELIASRVDDEMPDIDGTVFADLVGKTAAAVFMPMLTELRSSLSRRRLDNSRLLTGTDLQDMRDVFLVEPSEGGFATGSVRVFYSVPRAVQITNTQRIVVPGRDGAPGRVFRPRVNRQYSLQEVRANVSGSQYFIDVALAATQTGEEYNLDINEAKGATGFAGAVAVTNLSRFSGGRASDNVATLLDRIRSSVRLRSPATFAGLESLLLEKGVQDYYVAQTGDALMVRDRLYGPTTISGIPGGFYAESPEVPSDGDEPFVRLGIAFDAWVSTLGQPSYAAAELQNLSNEGAELLAGNDGSLNWDSAQPAGEQYSLTTRGARFLEVVGNTGMFPRWPGSLLPVTPGDVVEFEGLFSNSAAGIRVQFEVTTVVSGTELRLNPLTTVDPAAEPNWDPTTPTTHQFLGKNWRVLRRIYITAGSGGTTTSSRVPALCAPLTDPRALTSDGAEITELGYPALTKPYSTSPDTEAGAPVPRTRNVVSDATVLPVAYPLRVELSDPLSGGATSNFTYHRRYLHAEFIRSTAGTEQTKAVLARVHLMGPFAVCFPDTCEFRNSTGTTQMFPMSWVFSSATATGTGATTDVIEVGVSTGDPLEYDGYPGGPVISLRSITAGDWAFLQPTDDTDPPYALPITSVGPSSVTVAAADIPVGVSGTLYVYQGTSRAAQLSAGRGPEGTYSVDVWLRERAASATYTPADPPECGTAAALDEDYYLTQGFDLVSAVPGQQGSEQERATVCFHSARMNDAEELGGRTVLVHTPDVRLLTSIQDALDSDDTRPLCLSGLAKMYAPAYVTFSVYYVAQDLTAETAANAVISAFEEANTEDRLEVSDLVAAVDAAGATYTVNGRAFVLRMNHLRQWDSFATKGAIPAYNISQFILYAVTAVRLQSPAKGEVVDELDSTNWLESYTLRAGGFDAD
jgi:hypothetical protein